MEDYVRILDYLPQGYPDSHGFRKNPVAYGLGESEFKLLELTPKQDAVINIGDRVYIGKDLEHRKKIKNVKQRVGYEDLTAHAQSEMPYIIAEIVRDNEERFITFFNEAQAISTRYHMLELLPGLGKKTMWSIIEGRKKDKFSSFEDLDARVSSIHHPEKLIQKRIELELTDKSQKYHLFVQK